MLFQTETIKKCIWFKYNFIQSKFSDLKCLKDTGNVGVILYMYIKTMNGKHVKAYKYMDVNCHVQRL